VDVVALMSLATTVEVEAPLLAADLGSTPYETGLLLRSPSPVPLLRTEDRARALDLLARLRSRGHDAVACDIAAVVSADAMTQVRSFRLEPEVFAVTSAENVTLRLPWSEILGWVRAIHRTRTESVEKTKEKRFDLGRAAITGGVLMSKTVEKSKVIATEEREQVLYVFRRGGPPLLIGQTRVRYDGLGADLRPIQIENFTTLIRLVRERTPDAVYDERLLGPRPGIDRVIAGARGTSSSSSSDGIDLLAHLIAVALGRSRPYR
jgi:hypothetical protein